MRGEQIEQKKEAGMEKKRGEGRNVYIPAEKERHRET